MELRPSDGKPEADGLPEFWSGSVSERSTILDLAQCSDVGSIGFVSPEARALIDIDH